MAVRKKRLLIGMSGASGAPITVELLKKLRKIDTVESHLIVTRGARLTLEQETDLTPKELADLADVCYGNEDIGVAPASGSFRFEGMVIVPCSMKTVAGIASGYSDNLLLRAADVTIKEGRKMVLVARESPLSTIHLKNLYELSQMGIMIMPPMLTYYRRPVTLEECTGYVAERILGQFGLCEDTAFLRGIWKLYIFSISLDFFVSYRYNIYIV
ncbi:UbiX family flavin prenyltransferase [Candidatus Merdisoma sp. JLR.KK006]|uniref:UbiX family flavin prenyltransferase n=1 Tax=Candidatus Merdisoma sp. JLR.KK006 TaxID=3112626 RepID=UPI002FEE6E4F